MKLITRLIGVVLLSVLIACDDNDEIDLSCVSDFCNADTEGLGSLQGEPGLIVHHDSLDLYYILYSQIPSQGVGLVCDLPQQFKQDRLEIVFDAETRRSANGAQVQQAIFGNLTVHRQGRCLELTNIELAGN